jgi:dihydrodipicolinate synthase/N-acetylneuraminate lyase
MSKRSPHERVRPGRKICGMSAVLLPFEAGGRVDWNGYRSLLERTSEAGLTPAVNMDTGYVQFLDDATRAQVLHMAQEVVGGAFVAGAQIADQPGDPFAVDAYRREMERIETLGGTPIVFPSNGLNALSGPDWVDAHERIAQTSDRFLGFELGSMFVPYGRIYGLEDYQGLMSIPACIGAKHSSLSREREWDRLDLRDAQRPDFLVLTGNDLAIDMVMYGSDYLLGLSAFAPEAFARRDQLWAEGHPMFYELNDLLQYLGSFSFRTPVPAYKHDAALFLTIQGRIDCGDTHPDSPKRPASDNDVLRDIARRLEAFE